MSIFVDTNVPHNVPVEILASNARRVRGRQALASEVDVQLLDHLNAHRHLVRLRPKLLHDILRPLMPGAGGYIVGLAESASVPLVGAEYRAATAFVVLIAILLTRPTGLFGERA